MLGSKIVRQTIVPHAQPKAMFGVGMGVAFSSKGFGMLSLRKF